MKEIALTEKEAGQTLIRFLRRLFPTQKDSFFYKMLRKKIIVLNGRKATGKEVLAPADVLNIYFSDETFEKLTAGRRESSLYDELLQADFGTPEIIFENEDYLAMNKPAGLLSQKASPHDISANEILLSYVIREGALSREDFSLFHPSISNRLDRNTSGILFFAKTLAGQQALAGALRERTMEKDYLAIVHGRVESAREMTAYLRKDPVTNKVTVQRTPFPGAREIRTGISPLSSGRGLTLLSVRLHTGASHQIRAQLSAAGHPIVFDPKYGDKGADRGLPGAAKGRQMLHSWRSVLPDGRELICPPPADMTAVMDYAGLTVPSIQE